MLEKIEVEMLSLVRFAFITIALSVLLSAIGLAQVGQPASVTAVAGQGQVIQSNFPTNTALTVIVKDDKGNPVPGAVVNWTITQGTGSIASQSTTDSTGQASAFFIGPTVVYPVSFVQSTVSADIGSGRPAALFTVTTFSVDQSGVRSVQASLVFPTLADLPLQGQAGGTGTTPIQVLIRGIAGFGANSPIPNAAVRLISLGDPAASPTITCSGSGGGIVLTDSTGTANCFPVFGGKLGSNQFSVDAATLQQFGPFTFVVTSGTASVIRVQTGDQQSGNPGTRLPLPLVAQVTDLGGNGIAGVTTTFESVPAGRATFTELRNVSDSQGKVSALVTLGTTGGPFKVRVSGTTQAGVVVEAFFNLTVNAIISRFQKSAGDNQDAIVNTFFAQPLVITVADASGNPITNLPVQFTVLSGPATLETPAPPTDVLGRAATRVMAGPTAGTVTISATAGTFSQTFTLTVRLPGPSITAASFSLTPYNTAGQASPAVAPGSVVTITGRGLATGITGVVASPNLIGPLSMQVASVTVSFGGIPAPIFNVSNIGGVESITVQVPFEVAPGVVPVTVTVSGGSSTVNIQVAQFAPAIFETILSDGRRRAILLHSDGSLVTLENRAQRGETLRMFVTGLGQVRPSIGTNQVGGAVDLDVIAPLIVGVNNFGVRVISARYARNLIGFYEVQFQVPADTPPGTDIPFAIAVVLGEDRLQFGNPSSFPVQ